MPRKRSRVHPSYKTRYRVANWPEYDRSLVERGDLTIWLSPAAIATWKSPPSGRRGGQQRYSDIAVETALTIRLLLHLPLRQTEGLLMFLFRTMGVSLPVPDHTTLSRRGRAPDITLRTKLQAAPIDLLIDSTGVAIFGQGQWAAAKHGKRGIPG